MANASKITIERYYTDNAAPCSKCTCSVARYDVDAGMIVEVLCMVCHHMTTFLPKGRPETAAALSAEHRASA